MFGRRDHGDLPSFSSTLANPSLKMLVTKSTISTSSAGSVSKFASHWANVSFDVVTGSNHIVAR